MKAIQVWQVGQIVELRGWDEHIGELHPVTSVDEGGNAWVAGAQFTSRGQQIGGTRVIQPHDASDYADRQYKRSYEKTLVRLQKKVGAQYAEFMETASVEELLALEEFFKEVKI